jgi:hypothetical protein
MEIELPDGTILEAPDGADPSVVAKAYLAKQRRRRSPLEYASGLASQFNQGISVGFADELQAGGENLVNRATRGRVGSPYADSMARQRGERQQFQQDNPYASAAATALGAVLPSAASAMFAAPAAIASGGKSAFDLLRNSLFGGGTSVRPVNTVFDAVREGARAGAIPGFVAGAGTAEPGQRLEGAVVGTALGGAVGGAVGGAMQGGQVLSRKVEPYLRRVTDALNLEAGSVSRAVPAGPGVPGGTPTITSAEAKILRAMEEAGITPEAAAMALERARRANVPLGLADVGGQPIQRLTRAVRTLPGEGSAIVDDALSTRAAGQQDRLIGQLERGFGRVSSSNAGGRADALIARARTESGPLYRQLDSLPEVTDPTVLRIFSTPYVREQVQSLEASRRSLGMPVSDLYDEAGNLLRPITFRDVDSVKQSIDDGLRSVYQQGPRPADKAPGIATRQMQQDLQQLRRELITAADAAPGGQTYQSARSSYAGPAQARDAFEQGRELPRTPTELQDVRASLSTLSPAQRKWYERGALESLRNKIDRTPDLTGNRNAVGSIYGSRAERAKVQEVVNPRRRGLLDEALMMENQAAQTRNFVASGSQTADKAAEALDTAASVATDAATGNKLGLLRTAGEWLRTRVSQETGAEIARQVTNFDNPAAQQAFLERLVQLRRQGALQARDVSEVAQAMAKTTTQGDTP